LAPTRGALDVNINVALAYAGPYDPASGSPDIRGLRCRVTPIAIEPPVDRSQRLDRSHDRDRLLPG
jgi:hypothetical protein